MNRDEKKPIDTARDEERPLIELPVLIKLVIIMGALMIGLGLLFLPLPVTIGLFLAAGSFFFICSNPFLGLLLFMAAHFLQPVAFFPELESLRLVRILSFVALLAWILNMMIKRRFVFTKSIQNGLIILYGVLVLNSSFMYPEYSFPFFIESLKVFILFFLIVNLVVTERKLMIFVSMIAAMGAAISLIGIYQHVKGMGVVYASEGIVRVCGPFLDPNDFASHLISIIPLVMCLFWYTKAIMPKLMLLFISSLLVIALVFTYSRGGAVGLGIVLIGVFIELLFQKRKTKWIYIGGVIFMAIISISLIPENYRQRLQTVTITKESAIQSRLDAWQTGFEMMKSKPWIGIGLATYKYNYAPYAPPGVDPRRMLVAHNMFINVGAESGIPSLAVFLLIILISFWDMVTALKDSARNGLYFVASLSKFLIISLLGFLACSVFLSIQWVPILWILLALSVVIKNVSSGKNEKQN